MKVKVIVTKKGADLNTNAWTEGQELNVPEQKAEEFVKKGVAAYPEEGEKPKKTTKN